MSNEEIEKASKEINDTFDEKLKELKLNNSMPKEELDRLLEMNGELKVHQMINHECKDDDCPVCKMKNGIDQNAFRRGAIAGIRLGRKYPQLKVE